MITLHKKSRRGAVAALAMIYLMLFGTLTLAMFSMATLNAKSSTNFSEVDRARAAAESGLHWMQYRFIKMARPKTTIGNVNATVATALWPSIRTSVNSDFATLLLGAERSTTFANGHLTTAWISLDETQGRFQIDISPLATDPTILVVSSTGKYNSCQRTVSLQFKIEKKIKFAVAGKVPIQLGRNTIVEGPLSMTTPGKYPPAFTLSDFRGLNGALTTKIDNFNSWLKVNHTGFDNRVSAANPKEWTKATQAGYSDYTQDGYIDEYDLFVSFYDKNGDGAISKAEFTDSLTNKLVDADLFTVIDGLDAPFNVGDPPRSGFNDGLIDNRDGYAKVRGKITMITTEAQWKANIAAGTAIQDQLRGPIASQDENIAGVALGIVPEDSPDVSPSNFDTTGFKNKTGPAAGPTTKTPTLKVNAVITAADTALGTVNEKTPFGSTSFQATYTRPKFQGVTFRNCQIAKGTNAVFESCIFQGVTFVDMNPNILNPGGAPTTSSADGMTWSKRMKSGTFANTTALTSVNSWGFADGNNLRFNNCTFQGPITSAVPSAYTHFGNSWEFTGSTMFNNTADQTATILAPQTNIEMGSFTLPNAAPSKLTGVVVCGNIDIRGTSTIDGSIVVTGDGAGNTTLGWFGPSDAATDPTSPMPEGGYGRIDVRYNPYRSLPDGINMQIDLTPQVGSYIEGKLLLK